MNSNLKPAGVARPEATQGLFRVAIVGGGSLKGKEVAEVLEQRNFPAVDVKLLDDDEALGQLEALKDEITFIQSIRDEQFDRVDFTFFASDAESTLKNWKKVKQSGSTIIDLSYALEDDPTATLRAPWLERQLGQVSTPELQPGPAVIAHPIAVVLGLILSRLSATGELKDTVATVFEPASEHGQKGMDELHEQTVNLLSFQQLPKKIFDVQVAFNMVSRYGEQSVPTLSSVGDRVLKHFRRMVGQRVAVPSLLILQAPVFHGHAFAIHVRMDKPADLDEIGKVLKGEHISLVQSSEEAPSNVSAAGQGDILVSLAPDASDAASLWIWAATDNLRVSAATAVEVAESMAASRPRGKIQ